MLPAHLLVGSDRHGVTRHARELAGALGAPALSVPDAAALDFIDLPSALHVHVTDRLLGGSAADAAGRLVRLAGRTRLTVTLHDLPQPSDGTAYAARRDAYRRMLAAARGWAVSSRWERDLVRQHLDPAVDGLVVPLPVVPVHAPPRELPGPPEVGVLGWVYPGKGHERVIDAAAELCAAGLPVRVAALGGVSPGHDDLADALAARARRRGVGWTLTGYLSDADLVRRMSAVAVGVAAHTHVSASGSTNSWVAAGRRPLVVDSAYARETAALRPGCYRLHSPGGLTQALREALADPGSTRLPAGPVPWLLADAAAAYRTWWERLA